MGGPKLVPYYDFVFPFREYNSGHWKGIIGSSGLGQFPGDICSLGTHVEYVLRIFSRMVVQFIRELSVNFVQFVKSFLFNQGDKIHASGSLG